MENTQNSASFLNQESGSQIDQSLLSQQDSSNDKTNEGKQTQTTCVLQDLNNSSSFLNDGKQLTKENQIANQKEKQGNNNHNDNGSILGTQIQSMTSVTSKNQQIQKYGLNKGKQQFAPQQIQQLNKMNTILRQIKPQKQNKVDLQSPTANMLYYLFKTWESRGFCTPNIKLNLNITKPLQTLKKQQIQELFKYLPSVIISIDNQLIQNKQSIHVQEGDKIYEGKQDEYMRITTLKDVQKGNFQVESMYMGEVKSRQQHGKGVYIYHPQRKQTGWTYEGEFVNGKREGKGIQKTLKGVTYIGQFKNDYKHGQGAQFQLKRKKGKQGEPSSYFQKWKYQGKYFQGNRQDQKAVYICKYFTYQGPFRDNVKHGFGITKYKNGDVYEGQFENDLFSGKGTYTFGIGGSYQGEFKEGLYDGQGVQIKANQDKYEGQYRGGKKHGQGMYTWPDGDYYDGGWENDLKEGTGAQTNGSIFFDGEFHHGNRHGIGEETDEDGNTVKALWENNYIKKKIQVNGETVDD